MGVGMAADVDQKRGVVDGRPLLRVEPEPLGDPEGDQALPKHMLHRLAEPEIDTQRQRCDQLSQADAGGFARDRRSS